MWREHERTLPVLAKALNTLERQKKAGTARRLLNLRTSCLVKLGEFGDFLVQMGESRFERFAVVGVRRGGEVVHYADAG